MYVCNVIHLNKKSVPIVLHFPMQNSSSLIQVPKRNGPSKQAETRYNNFCLKKKKKSQPAGSIFADSPNRRYDS